VPLAIQKGVEDAKKNMFHVPVTEGGTVPHTVEVTLVRAVSLSSRPFPVPASSPRAGPSAFELAGITNVLSKSLGTDNALNIIKAPPRA